ncbi:MAG: hypothetical protein KDC79_13775 [Cyclobacteriaceae bacterium]|nr:hypothetical protein [Cyclobacteriaceae bacterium]
MNRILTFLIFFTLGINHVFAQNDNPIILGTKHHIHSNILEEDREYWISLPDSYNDETTVYKRYPVLIVLDGSAHFKSISGMVNYMSAGFNGNLRIPEMIVVAIQNVDRARDFTPDKIVTKRPNNFGGGDKFLGFLEEELIPSIDKEYRTQPYRVLFGHSLGGLLATHAYMKENTLFNAFIAVDPSFGSWDATTIDKKLEAVTDKSFERYWYIATSNWEKRNFKNRDRHVRLYEAMHSKCPGEFNAKLEYFENENHGSVPVIAFYNGISSIFDGYGIYYRDVKTKEQLVEHFDALSKRLSYKFAPPEELVNRVGYDMFRNNSDEAVRFFVMNTENYPQSANAFDSLGEAYQRVGEKEKATESYKKSLALNPANEHAKAAIKELKGK